MHALQHCKWQNTVSELMAHTLYMVCTVLGSYVHLDTYGMYVQAQFLDIQLHQG